MRLHRKLFQNKKQAILQADSLFFNIMELSPLFTKKEPQMRLFLIAIFKIF